MGRHGARRNVRQSAHRGATRPSYQIFSGNGIAVASMCAGPHKYRPVAANEGGVTGKVDISLEMGPTAHSWLTRGHTGVHR